MRMRSVVGVAAAVALVFGTIVYAQSFKKMNANGEANFIFANAPIEKGQEGKAKLKDTFTSKEKIYARGYFPGKLGKISNGEEMYENLWIDGKLAVRGPLEDVDATWDQMQAYLYNTGEDDFKNMTKALSSLSKGSHEVKLFFMRTKYTGTKKVLNDKGQYEMKKQYEAVNLTAGKFTFIVE